LFDLDRNSGDTIVKKTTALAFALLMILSIVFIGGGSSPTGDSFSAQAQTVSARRRNKGVVRRGYAGGKQVTRKVWRGGKRVTVRTRRGSKWVGRKSWRTGRKVVSRSKKVIY
jgi:hypothetical protein